MNHPEAGAIRKPRMDNRPLADVILAIWGYPAVLVAHDLKLFPLLAEQPRTLPEICEALHLVRRPAQALLAVCTSLGLVQLQQSHYRLTPLAEDYLLDSSPTYFGPIFDYTIRHYAAWSFENLKQTVLTDVPPAYGGGGEMFQSHAEHAELARTFTRYMHSASLGPALAWPDVVNLSGHRLMLDIGGGSGAHCIGAALQWPHLHAVVFDTPPVCDVAQECIAQHGLQGRIRTQAGDMWQDPFPPADLHLYATIYHDWTPEKCRRLTQKSFESLEPGGRLIIHEMLLNDEKTGPFPVAASSVNMLVWTEGEEYSGRELSAMLREANPSHR